MFRKGSLQTPVAGPGATRQLCGLRCLSSRETGPSRRPQLQSRFWSIVGCRRAKFNHAKHQVDPITQEKLDCNRCHRALAQSRDIGCAHAGQGGTRVTCHESEGEGRVECNITCHRHHHAPPQAATDVLAGGGTWPSFKQMLFGSARGDCRAALWASMCLVYYSLSVLPKLSVDRHDKRCHLRAAGAARGTLAPADCAYACRKACIAF